MHRTRQLSVRVPYCATNPNYGVANFTTGAYPSGIAVGDFDGDGIQDIVVTISDNNTVGVYFGTGSGSFGVQSNYDAGGFPFGVTVR
ncbi:MAG: VCBS repeat-containing protein, partial [Proteobacteria bacterium]